MENHYSLDQRCSIQNHHGVIEEAGQQQVQAGANQPRKLHQSASVSA